jgi:hypothetical protein
LQVSDRDEYRHQADFCERMARRAATPELKASWLRLAADWLALLRGSETGDGGDGTGLATTAEQDFDDMTDAMGTGQEDSTSSH